MNIFSRSKVISGTLAAILAVTFVNPVNAKELDTEIPSAGATVLIEEYLDNSGTEGDLLKFLPAEAETTTEAPTEKVSTDKKNETTENSFKSKEEELFSDIAIAKVSGGAEDYVNVRKKPNTNSKIVGKIYNNCGARILETTENGWYKIVSGNCTGYIKSDFFVVGEDAKEIALDNGYVFVNIKDTGIRVRKKNTTESDIVTNVYHNENYVVTKFDKAGNWVKIKIKAGVGGWISSEFVNLSINMDTAITIAEEKALIRKQKEEEERARQAALEAQQQQQQQQNNTNNNTNNNNGGGSSSNNTTSYGDNGSSGASAVVAYAKQFLGNPYVYGGSSLTNGTDCSGFTMSVYAHFGYSLNRSSYTQVYNGRSVSMGSLQPGDLLFYNNGGSTISHVAIYIGGGQIIHASTESTGIIIGGMGSPCAARRIIN